MSKDEQKVKNNQPRKSILFVYKNTLSHAHTISSSSSRKSNWNFSSALITWSSRLIQDLNTSLRCTLHTLSLGSTLVVKLWKLHYRRNAGVFSSWHSPERLQLTCHAMPRATHRHTPLSLGTVTGFMGAKSELDSGDKWGLKYVNTPDNAKQ